MHYSLMGKMGLAIINSDLLYRVAVYDRFDCSLFGILNTEGMGYYFVSYTHSTSS